MKTKLTRDFYNRDPIIVAKDLLGKYLIYKKKDATHIGKIVEVEAYLGPQDLAAHTSKGKTKRNAVMFGEPGHAYVYFIYGIYYCLNVVTGPRNHGAAILIRGLEPVQDIHHRTNGPGLLCKAMEINLKLNGHDLLSNDFYIAEDTNDKQKFTIVKKPRIGVAYAKHWAKRLLRFYIKNNPHVSKK